MPKRKENENENNEFSLTTNADQVELAQKKSRGAIEGESVDHVDATVDYDDSADAQYTDVRENSTTTHEATPSQDKGDEDQRNRILEALKGWCRSNITPDGEDDSDISERSEALAEVGMLLVFEYEKYQDANAMRSELSDIASIIGGEHVVTKFVNFLLSLQNQVKKAHAIAAARTAKKNVQISANQRPIVPVSTIPMHLRPAAQPVLFSKPVMAGQAWPIHPQQLQTMPQYNQNHSMPAPRKRESEFEIKRNQILAECTEHLKTLIEKASKASDPKEKATILELIMKVKGRMESLKSTSPPSGAVHGGSKPL